MGQSTSQSGIFYFKNLEQAGSFPSHLRKGLISRFEPRFTAIFGGLLLFFFVTVVILSNMKVPEDSYDEKAILKIQERYAQLVLNQPKPKPKPVEKVEKVKTAAIEETGVSEEETSEAAPVDRAKESFVAREERRASTHAVREKKREEVRKQVMSSGIFAAITASGGSGGGGQASVSDLLGTATDDLSDIAEMNISKGTFATKNESVDPATLGRRRSERVSNVGIEKADVGRAAVTRVASSGSVNITSHAPEISGESANVEERSQAAIGRIVKRETSRLKRVYENWLKRDPQLGGSLTIKFTILSTGSVSNVVITKTTMNNPDFDAAIVRYIKRWRFPAVDGAGPVEVVYPFVFEGQS